MRCLLGWARVMPPLGKLEAMTVLADSQINGAVQAAERILAARAGSAVSLADPEDLGGSGRTEVVRSTLR